MIRGRRGPHVGYLRLDFRRTRPGTQDATGLPAALHEYDTQSCVHCQALIEIRGTEYQGAPCHACGGLRCARAACAVCVPFLRRVEAQERRARFARAAGLVED